MVCGNYSYEEVLTLAKGIILAKSPDRIGKGSLLKVRDFENRSNFPFF
jgi:hypothetical protein